MSRSPLATSVYCQHFLLIQNDCNEGSSCLVTIQNERESNWLVNVIKSPGILHLFMAIKYSGKAKPVIGNSAINNTLDSKMSPSLRCNSEA